MKERNGSGLRLGVALGLVIGFLVAGAVLVIRAASPPVSPVVARPKAQLDLAYPGLVRPSARDAATAGLPDEETEHLGRVVQQIPTEFDALVILVDHDMSLVSSCCETTAVIDFGKLIASGPTPVVLRDEQVMLAYLGTEQVA